MKIKLLKDSFAICKVDKIESINKEYTFAAVTDEEISVVCTEENIPHNTTDVSKGWKGFRIEGILDFSLIGILAKISTILAENNIGIFVVSTYNTDYVFVKEESFEKAVQALENNGCEIV